MFLLLLQCNELFHNYWGSFLAVGSFGALKKTFRDSWRLKFVWILGASNLSGFLEPKFVGILGASVSEKLEHTVKADILDMFSRIT